MKGAMVVCPFLLAMIFHSEAVVKVLHGQLHGPG
jgi:hypothetical protein